ncbi:MAG TPA: VWA domain-containing protein [Pyrinomonadaceae bacterium]|nr:VWA domain-containing protein [Pyrinomonadaceae bacterium]
MVESSKDKSFTGLARNLSELPGEQKRAALEMSAALAGVSLKVSRAFVTAVPEAATILTAEDLKNWAELGRRLAMGSADSGVKFFQRDITEFAAVPPSARGDVFQTCVRQLVLSSSTALATFDSIPAIAKAVDDEVFLARVLKLAAEIAQRSAKHSAEFVEKIPSVAAAVARFKTANVEVADGVIALAEQFAVRTGGMTADLWAGLPDALRELAPADAVRLLGEAAEFLEFGGSVTLHFVSSGSDVLGSVPQAFADWVRLSRMIAKHGNAVLIAFLKSTPKFFAAFVSRRGDPPVIDIQRVLQLAGEIAATDAESALAAFKSSAQALKKVSIDQFEGWVTRGLADHENGSSKARRSYFALETRESNSRLQRERLGLPLESVQHVLRLYIEALTGNEVELQPLTGIPDETRIGDGKTIYLPAAVAEFGEDEKDFRLYKVLAAHGAGQIEFGTFARDTHELKAAFRELTAFYSATAAEKDAFSLDGYLGEGEAQNSKPEPRNLSAGSDYRAVLAAFPEPRLAKKIFGTMENARVDARLRATYRGLRKDLDLMQSYLRSNRPYIFDLPMHQVPFELLFQITLCGGATDDARQFYGQIVSEIEGVLETFVWSETATVADSLMATSRVYNLFQNITPDQQQEAENENTEANSEHAYDDKDAAESVTEDKIEREQEKKAQDIRDLFNAWNSLEDEGEPDDLQGAEAWSQNEMPEQALDADDVAFAYDEWDREISDYRVGWSRVIEKRVKQGDRSFVELTRSRYRGVISSIRHQFQLMKPENLTRINREIDGEDYDLNALVEFVVDRKADGMQTENIYTKRLRKQRDVAVSILLDQSSSTARTITRNPLQPYTHPGRRIIEIEKEGLVLMSEALEAVGDIYSINGFTSEGRRNVKFYVVKDFNEKYSDEVEKRIGGITFQNNTRLGAAIRHAAHKLSRQDSRTKLLIILTDGRPYDHDYGDARYAREDVREALIEAKTGGITPFCITIDRESEAELKDLYGDVGYTIIDDVLTLPERMPNIYRRLTS